jgi:hypothetical protein
MVLEDATMFSDFWQLKADSFIGRQERLKEVRATFGNLGLS